MPSVSSSSMCYRLLYDGRLSLDIRHDIQQIYLFDVSFTLYEESLLRTVYPNQLAIGIQVFGELLTNQVQKCRFVNLMMIFFVFSSVIALLIKQISLRQQTKSFLATIIHFFTPVAGVLVKFCLSNWVQDQSGKASHRMLIRSAWSILILTKVFITRVTFIL